MPYDNSSEVVVIRASSLSGYADCPRRSAARMFRREIIAAGFDLRETPPGIGAAIGTAVHKAAAVMLAEKADKGTLPPDDVTDDAAIETLRAETAPGILFDRESPEINAAELQVRRMARAYRNGVAPDIQPLLIEERLEAQVTPLIALSGQADVIAREPGRVRDLKTGKRLGNHAPQIGAYSLLARTPTEANPDGVDVQQASIDWVPRVSSKKPQPAPEQHRHDVARCETAALAVLRHIEGDLRTFREGDMARGVLPGDPWSFVANPSSMLCGPKYCPAHGTSFCREHAQTETEE